MVTSKFFKKVAIILLIAAFSIAGIVACGGAENIAGSGGVAVDDPGPTGPTEPEGPEGPEEPQQPTFPEDTYYKIYAPWVK